MFNEKIEITNTMIFISVNLAIFIGILRGNSTVTFGMIFIGIMYMLHDISNTLRTMSNKKLEDSDM